LLALCGFVAVQCAVARLQLRHHPDKGGSEEMSKELKPGNRTLHRHKTTQCQQFKYKDTSDTQPLPPSKSHQQTDPMSENA
jgi:hypothetical protein